MKTSGLPLSAVGLEAADLTSWNKRSELKEISSKLIRNMPEDEDMIGWLIDLPAILFDGLYNDSFMAGRQFAETLACLSTALENR